MKPLAFLVLCLVLAACGGGDPEDDEPEAEACKTHISAPTGKDSVAEVCR